MQDSRVVITGVGVLSCLGNTYKDVTSSLQNACSGIIFQPLWKELEFRSQVLGKIKEIDSLQLDQIPKKKRIAMPSVALFACLATFDAVKGAGLSEAELKSLKTGCLIGSGFTSGEAIHDCASKVFEGRSNRASPYSVVKSMSSTVSAHVTSLIPIGGRSYSIGSACSTGSHNIGHGYELIKHGILDTAIVGGSESAEPILAGGFNAMRLALSSKFNDVPKKASRPYDRDRDGFVISEGAGILILENLEKAKARKAAIYGEILGFFANSDGHDMVLPQKEGISTGKCMSNAIQSAKLIPKDIDYINTHGTSTVAGDISEVNAIKKIFGGEVPWFSSTKSMGGHAVGASGSIELIHCLSMLQHDFLAPSINIENLDPEFIGLPIVRKCQKTSPKIILSNSFGFGGTNASIIIGKYD